MIYIILRKVRKLTSDVMQTELIGSSFLTFFFFFCRWSLGRKVIAQRGEVYTLYRGYVAMDVGDPGVASRRMQELDHSESPLDTLRN